MPHPILRGPFRLLLRILTNFEEFRLYIVGGRPYMDEPLAGLLHREYYCLASVENGLFRNLD